ncbi:MAG: sugar ABC transporter substrate-binding protein [Kosmotogaceae bacterium]|nr:sugar ABC transporter substrate-binding protein [Kosmotogaceae bacterium]
MKKISVVSLLLIITSAVFAVTLDFYCLAWQPAAVDKIYDLVDIWNMENPDIQVNIIWGTWESSDQYLLTSFQGGNAPDVFHTDAEKFREYGMMGYAAPLNSYVTDDMIADIPTHILEDCYDFTSNLYGIPWCQETQVIFYNKDIFEERGIRLPLDRMISWEQLLGIAQSVTKKDENGNVITWGILAPLMERFHWTLIAQKDGTILTKDSNHKWKLEINEGAKEAIEFYLSLITEHGVMPRDVISIDYTSLMQGFINGKYAMVTFGCWNRRFLLQNKNFNWGMLLVKNGDNKINASDPQAFGISKLSRHKDEAFAFIEFMTNTENSAEISYSDYLFPVRESSLEDPRFSSPENEWDIAKAWLQYSDNVKPGMPGFYTFEWKLFVPNLEKVILGSMSLDEALKDTVVEGNKMLKKLGLQ